MAPKKLPPAATTAWGSFNTTALGLPPLASETGSSGALDEALTSRKTLNKRASLAARPSVRFALEGDDLHSAVAMAAARANASHLTEPGGAAFLHSAGQAADGPAQKPPLKVSASARGLAAARPGAQPYRASEAGAYRYGGAAGAVGTAGCAASGGSDVDADSGEDDGALGRDTCPSGDPEVPRSSHGGCSSRGWGREKTDGVIAVGGVSDGDDADSDLVQTWSGEPYAGCGDGHASRRSNRTRSRSRSRGRGGSTGGAPAPATSGGGGNTVTPSRGAGLRLPPAALNSACSVTSVVSRTAQMSGAFTPGSLAASAAASLRRPSSVKLEAARCARVAAGWASEDNEDEDEEDEDEADDEEGPADESVNDVGFVSSRNTAAARMAFATGIAAAVPPRLAPPAALLAGRGSSSSVSSRSGAGRGGANPKLPSSSSEARGGWRGYWRRGWSHFVAALGRGSKKATKAKAGDPQQQQQQQQSSAHERQGVPASGLSTMSVSSRSPSMMAFRLRAADSRTVNLRRMSKAKRNRARPSIFATGPVAAGTAVAPPPPPLPPAASRFAAGAAGAAALRTPQPPATKPSLPPHVADDPHAPRMSAPGLSSGLGAALSPGKVSSSGDATAAWVAASANASPSASPSSPQGPQPQAGGGDRQSFHRHSSLPAHRGFKRSSSSVVPEPPVTEAPAPGGRVTDVAAGLSTHHHQHMPEPLLRSRTTPRPKKTLSFSPTVHNDCGWTEPLRGTTSEGKRPTLTAAAPEATANSCPGPPAAPPKVQSTGHSRAGVAPAAGADGKKRVGWLQKLVRVFSNRHDPATLQATAAVTATPFLAGPVTSGGAPAAASGDSGGTWGSGSSSGGGGGAGGGSGGGAGSEHAVAGSSPSICSSSSSNARAAARTLRVLDSRVIHHRRLQHQHEQQQQQPQPQLQLQPQPHRLQASSYQRAHPHPHPQQQLHQQARDDGEGEPDDGEGNEGHGEEGADTEARAALRKRLLEHAASVREAPGDAGGSGPFYFLAATTAS